MSKRKFDETGIAEEQVIYRDETSIDCDREKQENGGDGVQKEEQSESNSGIAEQRQDGSNKPRLIIFYGRQRTGKSYRIEKYASKQCKSLTVIRNLAAFVISKEQMKTPVHESEIPLMYQEDINTSRSNGSTLLNLMIRMSRISELKCFIIESRTHPRMWFDERDYRCFVHYISELHLCRYYEMVEPSCIVNPREPSLWDYTTKFFLELGSYDEMKNALTLRAFNPTSETARSEPIEFKLRLLLTKCGEHANELLGLLIQYGMDLNRIYPRTDDLPIFQCIRGEDTMRLNKLFEFGATRIISNSRGITPLHYLGMSNVNRMSVESVSFRKETLDKLLYGDGPWCLFMRDWINRTPQQLPSGSWDDGEMETLKKRVCAHASHMK